jgi:hypothetical protein
MSYRVTLAHSTGNAMSCRIEASHDPGSVKSFLIPAFHDTRGVTSSRVIAFQASMVVLSSMINADHDAATEQSHDMGKVVAAAGASGVSALIGATASGLGPNPG